MNTNSENNSDKENEAEIAADRLIEMLEQQALYARIAKINEENTLNEDEDTTIPMSVMASRPTKMVYLKWIAAAASLIIGGLFFLKEEKPPTPSIAVVNTDFRGIKSIQSRNLTNGDEADYTNINKLINTGQINKAKEYLEKELEEDLEEIAPLTFRQGIIAYQTQDFTAAAKAFRQTIDSSDPEYIEDAYWNLLLSYKELGDNIAAKKIVTEMIDNPHITAGQKNAALKQI